MTKAKRHARAHHVSVALHKDDRELSIAVRDDGVGFDVMHAQQRAAQGQSLGLLGMEERIRLLEGRLSIRSSPGTGTEVTASIPLPLRTCGKE